MKRRKKNRKKWTPHRTTNRNKLNLTQYYANKFNEIYSCSAEMNCMAKKQVRKKGRIAANELCIWWNEGCRSRIIKSKCVLCSRCACVINIVHFPKMSAPRLPLSAMFAIIINLPFISADRIFPLQKFNFCLKIYVEFPGHNSAMFVYIFEHCRLLCVRSSCSQSATFPPFRSISNRKTYFCN